MLSEMYSSHSNAEIADALNSVHGNGRTANSVTQHAKKLGLTKPEGYRKPHPKTIWPDEKREWFRLFVPGHSESEINDEHERLYGFRLTRPQIKNAKSSFGVRSGTHGGCFEKGMTPHNKGKTWADYGTPEGHERSRGTQFKKGEVNGRAEAIMKPVGTERVNRDGYVEVKVSTGLQERANSNFRLKHRVVYEQVHGSIPRGCNVVFADGDKSNFDPDNLVAVPRDLWSVISRSDMEYHDRQSLETCMNIARLERARHAVQCRPRNCKKCGHEFKPRYAHQRTCDVCLGRTA